MKTAEMSMDDGAFGNPDGVTANLAQFLPFGGLGREKYDPNVRVIVGRRGSGKTLYLRFLETGARAHGHLHVVSERALPTSPRFQAPRLEPHDWQLLWRRAILRALAFLLVGAPQSDGHSGEETSAFYDRYRALMGRRITISNAPVDHVSAIVKEHSSIVGIARYLSDPLWDSFEARLAEAVSKGRQVGFFIDEVDAEFCADPADRLECQRGLFFTVMRLMRCPGYARGLTITICISDTTYLSIVQTPENAVFGDAGSVRNLDWSANAAMTFLRRRVDSLPEIYLTDANAKSRKLAWLGMERVWNKDRNIDEDLLDYILRHTRFMPREIVQLGNALSARVFNAKANKRGRLTAPQVRETVAAVSADIGRAALHGCAEHLSIALSREFYSNGQDAIEASGHLSDRAFGLLCGVLREIGQDVFTFDQLQDAISKCEYDFCEETRFHKTLIAHLWQHGLLGYRDSTGTPCQFFGVGRQTSWLSSNRNRYVLHSSLIDALNLRPVGKYPVSA